MRQLNQSETFLTSGGDGYFKVIIKADVPADCAAFIATTWEQYLIGELNFKEATQIVYASPFDTHDIEKAIQSIDFIFWK